MKHYDEQELDAKIHAFLTKKLQKYPELDIDLRTVRTPTRSGMPTHPRGSLTWFRSQITH